MLIVCPNCATSYRIEPSSLGTAGRSVRCVRCQSVWLAHESAEFRGIAELTGDDRTARSASFAAIDGARNLTAVPLAARYAAAAAGFETAPAVKPADGKLAPLAVNESPVLAGASATDDMPPALSEPATRDCAPVPLRIGEVGIPPIGATSLDEDIETFVARRAARKAAKPRGGWTLRSLPTAIAVLAVANIILVAGRTEVVRILPQTASLYAAIGLPVNVRGLSFNNVASSTEINGGAPVMIVEGTIVSTGKRAVEVPRLRFSVRNRRGQEIYAWTSLPSRNVLPPGETLAFRSRLASPPADGHDVTVRFFNRRDRVAGLQEGGR